MIKRIALATLAAIPCATAICAFSWLLGFDFDERGTEAFMTAYIAFAAGLFAWLGVYWKLEQRT